MVQSCECSASSSTLASHLQCLYVHIEQLLLLFCVSCCMSKVSTDDGQVQRVSPTILLETDSDKNDACIGAAILQLTDCPTPTSLRDSFRESEVTLPLQPRGSIQLGMSFARRFDISVLSVIL